MKLGRQKLLGSLRGAGELRALGRAFAVRYELDRFSDRQGQRASGSLTADLAELRAAGEEVAGVLVLEDGAEISVLASNAAADGADIEATGLTLEE